MRRMPSIVSTALPTYLASPVPHGKTSGSKMMSSAGIAVLLGQERVAAPRDLELALAGDGHAVLGVLVDRADDERGAVPLRQRHDRAEALLAVLQVDRVDDRLALAPLQAELRARWRRSSRA